MKFCNKCGVEKELERFGKHPKMKDGYRNICNLCRKPKKLNIIIVEGTKICNKCNLEKDLSEFVMNKYSKKGYRGYCKKCANIDHRKSWHKLKNENPEEFKEIRKQYKKKYRPQNRIKDREKYKNDILYKFKSRIRYIVYASFKTKRLSKNLRTLDVLGCSVEFFKEHLESKFETWMKWENHGNYTGKYNETWQIDHIIPIDSALTEEDVIMLNHYTNLRPLCSRKNLEKSNNIELI